MLMVFFTVTFLYVFIVRSRSQNLHHGRMVSILSFLGLLCVLSSLCLSLWSCPAPPGPWAPGYSVQPLNRFICSGDELSFFRLQNISQYMALGQEAFRNLFLHVLCHALPTLPLVLLAFHNGPSLGSLEEALCSSLENQPPLSQDPFTS